MPDQTVTRLPNGLVNADLGNLFGDLRIPRPNTYFEYFDDFSQYTADEWVVTETDAGATQSIAAAANGVLALQNTAGASDIVSLQWAGDGGTTVRPLFGWTASKDLVVAGRMKVDQATLASFTVGLAVADTSPTASLPGDGIFINKGGASTNPSGFVRAGGGSTSQSKQISGGAIVADTFFDWGIVYTSVDRLFTFYFNGGAARFSDTVFAGPTALLTPTIAVANGSAAARLLSIDWFYAATQR